MAQRVALVVHDEPIPPHVNVHPEGTDVHFWVGTTVHDVLLVLQDVLDGQACAAVQRLWTDDDAVRQVVQIGPGLIRVTEPSTPA